MERWIGGSSRHSEQMFRCAYRHRPVASRTKPQKLSVSLKKMTERWGGGGQGLVVEAAGVEPASESDPPRASTCLSPSEVLSPPGPGWSRKPGGQPPLSRLPPEGGRGKPAGYSASIGPATGGADPRTSLLFRQRVRTVCCQLLFASRINEGDWVLGMQPWLQHSRRTRCAPMD